MAGLQGRVLGGFQLTEQLGGGGGIADVYRARPAATTGREVVVKVLYPEFAQHSGFAARFRQIVQNAGRLATHPHILPLVASGEEGGYLYLVTPYVAAGSLKDWLGKGGRFGVADAGPFFRQVCDAVGYAHSLGILHGNLKPSNVFLFEGRHVLLGDFGMLWDLSLMDMNHAGPGTEAVEYLAPEVAGGQTTQQSDIYSLGALLYAAATGVAPFRAATPNEVFAAHARQPVPHLAQVTPAVHPAVLALDPVIQRAMAKRPEERFPSAAAVAQAIETAARQPGAALPGSVPLPGGPGSGPFIQPQPGAPPQTGPGLPSTGGVGFTPLAAAAAAYNGGPALGAMPGMPAPAIPLAQAAASLAQAGPLFPPLPPGATIDENMEQGRSGGLSGDSTHQPTLRFPAPAQTDLPQQPTMRVPAPLVPEQDAANGDMPQREMPVIKRPRIAPAGLRKFSGGPRTPDSGFMVAGGSAAWGDAPAAPAGENGALMGEHAAFPDAGGGLHEDSFDTSDWPSDGRDFSASAVHDGGSFGGLSEEQSGWGERRGSDRLVAAGGDGWGGNFAAHEDASAFAHASDSGSVRAFSPTQLGLPRLTSPELGGAPPSWQDVASGHMPAVAPGQSAREGWHEAAHDPWSASGPVPNDAAWSGSAGNWDANAANAALEAEWAGHGVQVPAYGGAESAAREGRSRRQRHEEPVDSGFDDDHVWTVGLTAVRRRNRRALYRLTLLLALVLLVDIVMLVVARPDLCPTAGCRDLSVLVHQKLPMLPQPSTPAPVIITANPTAIKLTTAASKSATAKLTLQSVSAGTESVEATTELPWLTIRPTGVPLAPGGTAQLTITAKPAGIKPGTYTTSITVTVGAQTLTVPVTVVVTAG